MPQLDKFTYLLISLLLLLCNIVVGIINFLWFPGEVASPLVIAGGASAIFFLFFAKSDEERSLSLFAWLTNNLIIFYGFNKPDICCFVVCLCLILLASFHIYLFFGPNLLFHFMFYAILLSRSFFHHQMGEWGFGLVTELLFISLILNMKMPQSDKFTYLIPIWCIAAANLHLHLGVTAAQIGIHVIFICAGGSIIQFTFLSETFKELNLSFSLYFIFNLLIGALTSPSLFTFLSISSIFLLTNSIFICFFYLKAKLSSRSLGDTLLSNNKEGIKNLLVIYFLVLGFLISQLNTRPEFTTWFIGIGIQVGFLSALIYLFDEGESKPSGPQGPSGSDSQKPGNG